MIAYKYNENENGLYIGTQNCQINPIATRGEGHDVWLLPANCTFAEPPQAREGYTINYINGEWNYVEMPKEPEPEPPTLEEVKANKIAELKRNRDTEEVEPIEYNGNTFDYDSKAQSRINVAYQVLQSGAIAELTWTTADNQNVVMTANDFRRLLGAVAARSNTLHVKYRELKAQVEACKSKSAVEKISW